MGFHGREDERLNIDPDLRLIHLHRMDYEICRERHQRYRSRGFRRRDREEGWGTHNLITADDEFDEWFYAGSCFQGPHEVVVERIPEAWKSVV